MKKPLYSHPCTWVFIDDHTRFLRALDATLPERQPRKLFDKPREALEFLKGCQSADFLKPTSSYEDEELVLRLDLGRITSRLTDANRFAQVSVVVCDYAMPGMNGLELLEQIPDRAIKRILLTGVADEETAVAAFNAGTIDRFVKKGSGVFDELLIQIEGQEDAWFLRQQADLYEIVLAEEAGLLNQKSFGELFREVCKSHNIVEYYFSISPRGYLLLDPYGRCRFLYLVRDDEFAALEVDCLERGADALLVAEIAAKRKVVMVFEKADDVFGEQYDWAANSYDTKLTSIAGWRYSLIDNPPLDVDFGASNDTVMAFISGA